MNLRDVSDQQLILELAQRLGHMAESTAVDSQPQPPNEQTNKTTFSAICTGCGKTCDLPFKPDKSRAVYCNDCYKRKQN